MASESSSSSNDVIGSTSIVLTIVFIVLKLTHVINWSWWWVLSPLWIGAGIAVLTIIVVLVVVVIAGARS
ncbi:hypothetical protein AHiyo1_09070 [Arthrobacter sp. Hiyo1]|uniref:hypothetical protein n=1 Tax=Arthrobacter sp. Hiyo1 TaxID=1588020 RepID=UPI00072355DD|nr:hypothetical protein [Arthrobacter sp. Hiyo1]GAP57945.1 hypothetical protein AHiyo1_09070 [Arthrobacter sp. Hiyo1]